MSPISVLGITMGLALYRVSVRCSYEYASPMSFSSVNRSPRKASPNLFGRTQVSQSALAAETTHYKRSLSSSK